MGKYEKDDNHDPTKTSTIKLDFLRIKEKAVILTFSKQNSIPLKNCKEGEGISHYYIDKKKF